MFSPGQRTMMGKPRSEVATSTSQVQPQFAPGLSTGCQLVLPVSPGLGGWTA